MKRSSSFLIVVLFVLSSLTTVLAQENHPPIAEAGPDKYIEVGSTAFFDGSDSSDPDGDELTYSWDFDDSNGIQEEATGVLVSKVFNSVGEFTVTLTASDANFSDTDTCVVYVLEEHTNRAPTAEITEPANFSAHNVTVAVHFSGEGSSDPDGDLLTYDWDFGDGATDQGKTVDHKYGGAGVYTVALTVSDGEFDSTAEITIFVEGTPGGPPGPPPLPPPPNTDRPLANANGPYEAMAKDEIYLSSAGSKAFSPEYCWDLDQSNGIQAQQCFDPAATKADWETNGYGDTAYGPFPVIAYEEPGNYTITLIIRASYGDNTVGRTVFYRYNYTTTQAIITPHDTIEIDAGKDKEVESGEKTTFTGKAKIYSKYEPEYFVWCGWDFESDGIWDYELEFDVSEKLQEIVCTAIHTYTVNVTTKEDTVFNATFGATADGLLTLYVTSNSSDPVHTEYNTTAYDTTQRIIPAPPNQVPVIDCGVDKTGDNSAFVGEETEFTATAEDPDGDMIVSYMWDFNNDAQIDYSSPASGNAHYTYKSAGTFVAKVNVTDERGGEGVCYVNVTVKSNSYPVVSITGDEEAEAGEEADFDGSESYDPDGEDDIDSFTWDFDASDGFTADATGKYASHTFSKGGSYTVTLKVRDKHGAEESATHDITITQTYGVLLDVSGLSTVDVKPGASHTFSLRITNTGSGDDCYDIDKSGTKSTWGELSTTEACLKAGEGRDLTLRVSVPYAAVAEDQATLKIEAVSQSESSATDVIQLKVNAEQSFGVSVYMVELRADIKQGENKKVSFKMTNLGNGEDSYKLEAAGPDKAWVQFSKSTETIKSGSSKEVTVTFIVPSDAKTGEHTITLTATSNGDATKKDSLVFTVNVKEGESSSAVPGFDMVAVLMGLSIVTAVLVIRRRR